MVGVGWSPPEGLVMLFLLLVSAFGFAFWWVHCEKHPEKW